MKKPGCFRKIVFAVIYFIEFASATIFSVQVLPLVFFQAPHIVEVIKVFNPP